MRFIVAAQGTGTRDSGQARGTTWIDDVQIREVTEGENPLADLWFYDPYRVELGNAPLKKYGSIAAGPLSVSVAR